MAVSELSWRPLAVALVSSGSRGNKLLFYHCGVQRPQNLENELLSTLPQRTLAEILAPCSVMKDRKFELRVDEWKFVGHPFSVQTTSLSITCNIAFVLQSICSPEVVRSYVQLSRALGAATKHEEYRTEFLKEQVGRLIQITEEVDTIDALSEKSVECSSMAKSLLEVLCWLQNGNPHVHVWMNDWSEVSVLVHCDKRTVDCKQKKENVHVRSYSALIMLKGIDDIIECLPSSCNPSFYRFLTTISPVKSLHQVALDADIPLQQAVKFASHLVHWSQAMTVYPLSETNVYVTSPTADTASAGEHSQLFLKNFSDNPDNDGLPSVLCDFSSPITLAEMRDLYGEKIHKLIPYVTWLLKHEQIIQLHTYIYLVPPETSEDTTPLFTDSSHAIPHVNEDILKRLQTNLSELEVSLVLATNAATIEEDLEEFSRLCCYFHGNHHLEEILMLENMTRSQLLTLIDKFSEILTTVSLTEHAV